MANKRKNLQTILLENLKKRRKSNSRVNLPSKDLLQKIKDIPLKDSKEIQPATKPSSLSESEDLVLENPGDITTELSTIAITNSDSLTSEVLLFDINKLSSGDGTRTTTVVSEYKVSDEASSKFPDLSNDEETTTSLSFRDKHAKINQQKSSEYTSNSATMIPSDIKVNEESTFLINEQPTTVISTTELFSIPEESDLIEFHITTELPDESESKSEYDTTTEPSLNNEDKNLENVFGVTDEHDYSESIKDDSLSNNLTVKQGTSDDNTQKSISEVLLHTQRGNPKIIEIEKQTSKPNKE